MTKASTRIEDYKLYFKEIGINIKKQRRKEKIIKIYGKKE